MYVLQSVPLTAARAKDATIEGVAEPSDPMRVPHATAPPGASVLLVPGANPTIVKSKLLAGAAAIVPGTRKATASIWSVALLKFVPVPSQHFVFSVLNGMKLGPCGSVIVAHQT